MTDVNCDEIQAQLDDLEAELNEYRESYPEMCEQFDALSQELYDINEIKQDWGTLQSEIESNREALENEGFTSMDSLEDRIDELRETIRDAESEAEKLREEITRVSNAIEVLESKGDLYEEGELETWLEIIDDLREELDAYVSSAEEFEDLLEAIEDYDQMMAKLEEWRDRLDTLSGELEQVNESIMSAAEELERLLILQEDLESRTDEYTEEEISAALLSLIEEEKRIREALDELDEEYGVDLVAEYMSAEGSYHTLLQTWNTHCLEPPDRE